MQRVQFRVCQQRHMFLFLLALFPTSPHYHRAIHETDISTQQAASQAHTRLSRPDGHARRSQGTEPASREGSRPPHSVGRLTDGGALAARVAGSAGTRLRRSSEFGRVFADPLRSSDIYFTVLARANELDRPRLGLAISRRAAPRAVDRNKLKRLARESFRHRADLPAADFVVLARPGAARAVKAALRESLDRHFTRLADRAGA
jgi:ribonuclease P protein component